MNAFFETSKKTARGRPLGRAARALRILFNVALILATAAVVSVGVLYLVVVSGYQEDLGRRYPALVENSYVYDADGKKIATLEAAENRETVGPNALGDHLPRAVVAVEDRRFRDHFGVDVEGVARAAWTDLRAWEVHEGGSTITEQLMKNLYVPEEDRLRVSFSRRFVQSSLAFAYERRHSKEEILTAYLNAVYYGDGAYGAQTAARSYFGKDAKDLTLSEAATLAGFLHAPSTYTAWTGEPDAERAEARRDEVLAIMRGQGMISAAEAEAARDASLEFAPDPAPEDPDFDPYLERVRREVEGQLGPVALEQGGLRIHTTVDPELQHAAVESKNNVLNQATDPSAAVVTVEPQTGAIRALVGQKNGFNLALDGRRQPASAFKPFVLATALAKENVSPESVYVSQTLSFRYGEEDYVVNNYDGVERGLISIYEAMAESDNTVFVQLATDLGLSRVASMARALGITTPVEPYPSTAIGGLGVGVSPLDMASSYATFAGGGIHRGPYAVERIEHVSYGNEEDAYDHRIFGSRVLTGNQAAATTRVLRGVVESGTATMFHDLDKELGKPSAGKTGTSDDFADAWYVGYTPRLCTSVWVGYPDGRRSMVGVHGIKELNGETLPMDIWSSYMAKATEDDPPQDFPAADMGEFDVFYAGS